MTSQAADGPESVAASRRSKLTPEREQEFFDAVLEQIRECGYEAVTMEGVATSTRCSKSTLYRQWKTKPQFVVAALRSRRQSRLDGIDTGSLAEDLREAARGAARWSMTDTKLLQALGHAVTQDADLAGALREAIVEPEITALREILRRGVERGEVAAGHPALEYVPAQMFGMVRARPVVDGEYADEAYLLRFVEAVVLPALGLAP
ncbi:TetR/AcrR family transcriptional regulator C-terminal ligand-binding domain-containing protein [Streptomyces phaeoluteigriseus]